MSGGGLVALPGGRPDRPASWELLLREAVRPEFRVEVYRPAPGDPVLFGPSCVVAGCLARGLLRMEGMRGHLCQAHAVAWRRDGEPPLRAWVRHGARSLRGERIAAPCAAAGCRRSIHVHGFCYAHFRHWARAGKPPRDAFAAAAPPATTSATVCRVADCCFPAIAGNGLCDTHHRSFRWLASRRPDLDPDGYVEHLATAREQIGPRFDLRGVGPIVALELGYALQCRHDQRGAAITPLIFGQVARWLRDRPVDSLLIGSESPGPRQPRSASAPAVAPTRWRGCATAAARWRGYGTSDTAGEVWDWDTWPTDRIDPTGRYAHQPVRRIYFADIEPAWLRELAKRWARWRITTATKSPASVAVSTSSLRRFTSWLATRDQLPERPAQITRGLLEDYRAHVHTLPVSAARRNGLLTDLKVFLDDVRLHEWAPGLAANAAYYRGEIPRKTAALPRFVDEFVMGHLSARRRWTGSRTSQPAPRS